MIFILMPERRIEVYLRCRSLLSFLQEMIWRHISTKLTFHRSDLHILSAMNLFKNPRILQKGILQLLMLHSIKWAIMYEMRPMKCIKFSPY